MGNLCDRESSSRGHVLGPGPSSSSAPGATGGRVPPGKKRGTVGGPGRTLEGGASVNARVATGEQLDARTAAALAAEKRNSERAASGKLGLELNKQKRMTQSQHIQELGKVKGQQERLVWD